MTVWVQNLVWLDCGCMNHTWRFRHVAICFGTANWNASRWCLFVCLCIHSVCTHFGSWQLLLNACNQFTAILMTIGTIDYWFLIRSIRLRAIALSVCCVSIFSCKCINVVLFASRRTAHARSRCINNSSVTFNFVGINQSAYVTVLDFSVFWFRSAIMRIFDYICCTHTRSKLEFQCIPQNHADDDRNGIGISVEGLIVAGCNKKSRHSAQPKSLRLIYQWRTSTQAYFCNQMLKKKNQQHLIIVSLLEASRNYYFESRHNSCLCVVSTSFTEQIALKNWVFFPIIYFHISISNPLLYASHILSAYCNCNVFKDGNKYTNHNQCKLFA